MHAGNMPYWTLLTLLFCVSAASKAAITSDGRNVHITTPGRSGSVIVDGSVDIKQLQSNNDALIFRIDAISAALQDELASSKEQEVGCCSCCCWCVIFCLSSD
jgi:hypothetical protein